MSRDTNLFSPIRTVRQQVTTTPSLVALPSKQRALQITVEDGGNILVLFGTSDMSAVQDTNGHPYFSGWKEVIEYPEGATHASVKTVSGSAFVSFTSGDGE